MTYRCHLCGHVRATKPDRLPQHEILDQCPRCFPITALMVQEQAKTEKKQESPMKPNADIHAALQRLNREAYAAARVAQLHHETELLSSLRNICWWTDEQVDKAAPSSEVM